MAKKLKVQMNGHSDEFGTPIEGFEILEPYIKKESVIYECAYGGGSLARIMEAKGFKVVSSEDFFKDNNKEYDIIITNPPYSLKEKFLQRAYELGKPFAFLMPLTALEGKKRGELFKKYGIQLIIPNRRINFITPSGKGSGAWFCTGWFCYKFNLPKDLNFVELEHGNK